MKLRSRIHEEEVKDFLETQGYSRAGTVFREFELVAIQRPGWVQIYEFTAVAKSLNDAERTVLYGAMRDDQRATSDIKLFSTQEARIQMLPAWKTGLIEKKKVTLTRGQGRFLMLFFTVLSLALISAIGKSLWRI